MCTRWEWPSSQRTNRTVNCNNPRVMKRDRKGRERERDRRKGGTGFQPEPELWLVIHPSNFNSDSINIFLLFLLNLQNNRFLLFQVILFITWSKPMVVKMMAMVVKDVMWRRLRGWLKCECDFLLFGTFHLEPCRFILYPRSDLFFLHSILFPYPLLPLDTFGECTSF